MTTTENRETRPVFQTVLTTESSATPASKSFELSNIQIAKLLKPTLTEEELLLIDDIDSTDWGSNSLDLTNPEHRDLAARALAVGSPVFHGFGNFYALTFHPDLNVMRAVNVSKGRPLDQVASVTTSPDRIYDVFDWDNLPDGLDAERIQDMMARFFHVGPFGFRGPATPKLIESHPHLTSMSGHRRTVQLIAPGFRCDSNDLYTRALDYSGEDFLAITSANLSKTKKGGILQPAHNRIRGIQKDFGDSVPQSLMVAHRHEKLTRTRYRHMEPTSTSIIGFHTDDVDGNPIVTIDRHGSLPIPRIVEIVKSYGMTPVITDGAKDRQPLAHYPHRFSLQRS